MDIDLDTGRLAVFIGGISCCFIAERFFTARTPSMPVSSRLILHSLTAVLNTTIIRVLAYVPLLTWIVYVEEMGWGISRWLGLTGWFEFLISVIVIDAFDYFWHRANHRVTFLWRFHKTHHNDNDMDVFTSLRFHPGEFLLSALAKGSWVFIWGPSAIAWFLFEALVSLCAQMHHSNIDFPDTLDRQLSRIIVTPRFHTLHHLVDRSYGDQNFSTILSCWDSMFGTRAPKLSKSEIIKLPLGLPEGRESTLSVFQLLLEPIKHRNLGLASKHQTG
tara:strand:- start:215 stop:1039 length:825 start_codon:yes stop_codon:yes gene_type:complete